MTIQNQNFGYVYRIFLLIILPLLIGWVILPHSQTVDGKALDSPTINPNNPNRDLSYSFAHSEEDLAGAQRINAVFPLADFLDFPPFISHGSPVLCFEDNGSFVTLPNGSNQTPDLKWMVLVNNKTKVFVKSLTTNCTEIKPGQDNSYNWLATIKLPGEINLSEGNVTFTPKTRTFPRVTMDYGLLQGVALIPVAYLLIWYPAAGILKKIKKGLEEQ